MSKPSKRHQELLELARKRYRQAAEAWRDVYDEARKDLEFLAGQQWDPKTKHDRELANRPALVLNKLPTYWQQVANEARQNKPSIRINAVDNDADPDTAKVMQGLIRHIEYSSDADVAYNTAFEYAVGCGIGFYRIRSDYVDERSFDQELLEEAIPDPFSVLLDPAARKADRSDARYGFEVEDIPREEFEQMYPDSETVGANFFADGLPYEQDWIRDDAVRVANYWYVESKRRKLLLLSTGSTLFADELGEVPEGVTVLDEREVLTHQVKSAKINGCEVLEENEDYDGQWIPIVAVTGKEVWIEGKRHIFSLVRFARDPQALYNYYKTAQAEAVQLAPKSPWIGAEGQFSGHEAQWKTANWTNYAYLEYKPVSLNGQPVPPPQRNTFEPPIQALSLGALQANDDIKATTGIFDPSLGARSNETSGIAIQRRQQESDAANYHFLDNLARSQRFAGRILLDLIPKRYDTPRQVRIIGEDEAQRVVTVNQRFTDPGGASRFYDLSAGRYDVTVSSGPSYTTKRLEAFDFLAQLVSANPQILMIAGDLMMRHSDVAGADQLADRLRQFIRATNPQLQIEEEGKPNPIPPEAQAKLAQMDAMIQQLSQALDQASEEIRTKKLELESRERIAALEARAKLVDTEARLQSQENMELLRQEIARIEQQIEIMFRERSETRADEEAATAAASPETEEQAA